MWFCHWLKSFKKIWWNEIFEENFSNFNKNNQKISVESLKIFGDFFFYFLIFKEAISSKFSFNQSCVTKWINCDVLLFVCQKLIFDDHIFMKKCLFFRCALFAALSFAAHCRYCRFFNLGPKDILGMTDNVNDYILLNFLFH